MLTDLCHLTGLTKQTVNSAIRILEKDDVVRLEAVNAKAKKVILTKRGLIFADKIVARLMNAENEIFEAWNSEDVAQYLLLTERFLVAIKEKTETI